MDSNQVRSEKRRRETGLQTLDKELAAVREGERGAGISEGWPVIGTGERVGGGEKREGEAGQL